MEKGDRNLNQWVDERIARLEAPAGWYPDTDRGLAGVRRKNRSVRRRRWGLGVAGLAALASALFTIPGCEAATCKVQSQNLAERLWKSVFVAKPPEPKPQPVTQAFTPPPTPSVPKPVKSALLTCEFYTDYECPACARFYLEIVPQLKADYVATGKMKLVHRDYPLAQHRYSRLAARYAAAARVAGQYEVVATQLFRTQSSWGMTGDIDAQLAQVLPDHVMAEVRRLVQSDPHLDDTIEADLARGRADQIAHTPSVVIVANGERRGVTVTDYASLKVILDGALP